MAFVLLLLLQFYVHFPYLFKKKTTTTMTISLQSCFLLLLLFLFSMYLNFSSCLLASYLLCFNGKVVRHCMVWAGMGRDGVVIAAVGPVGQAHVGRNDS